MRLRQPVAALGAALTIAAMACGPGPAIVKSEPPVPTSTPAPTVAPTRLTVGQVGVAERAIGLSLWNQPGNSDRELAVARAAGFTWIKQRFAWRDIEPEKKGEFVWTEADRVVNAVGGAGLKLIVEIDQQPRWASSRVSFPTNGPPDDPADLADFLSALSSRYRSRIQAYEIWDQPNLAAQWGARRPNPGEYARMLRAAYAAIKPADPDSAVVSAALAPTTRYDETSVPDLIYLRSLYGANIKGGFDVMGVDASTFSAPACMDPQQVAEDATYTLDDQTLPIEGRRVYAFRHVEDVRDIMVDRGDASRPIAILAMNPATQTEAFACARELWSPWIGFLTVTAAPTP